EVSREIRPAILAEAARWGGLRGTPPRTPDDDWEPAVALLEKVMTSNAAVFLDRLRSVAFLPALEGPQFRSAAGPPAAESAFIITGAAECRLELTHIGTGTTEPPPGTYRLIEGQPLEITARPEG